MGNFKLATDAYQLDLSITIIIVSFYQIKMCGTATVVFLHHDYSINSSNYIHSTHLHAGINQIRP